MKKRVRKALSRSILVSAALLGLFWHFVWNDRGEPRLTAERVVQELGDDALWFDFVVVQERCVAEHPCTGSSTMFFAREVQAAVAAGWATAVCETDPGDIALLPAGRAAAAQWQSNLGKTEDRPCHEHEGFFAVAGHYRRTGPPIIRPGADRFEKLVTIPGHYEADTDSGKRLLAIGYAPLLVVDRIERFTLWKGVWARKHPDI